MIVAAVGTASGVGSASGDSRAWSPAMVTIEDPKSGVQMDVERNPAGLPDFWKFANPGWRLVRELAKAPPPPALTDAQKEEARLNSLTPAQLIIEMRKEIDALRAILTRKGLI